jgi:hypothetical protein
MSDLAATAERLRVVKRACEHFLALWALDHLLARPVAVDQFNTDIHRADENFIHDPCAALPIHRRDGLDD